MVVKKVVGNVVTCVLGSIPVVTGRDVLLIAVVVDRVVWVLSDGGIDVVISVENGVSVVVNRDVLSVVSVEAVVVEPSVDDCGVVSLDVDVCNSETIEEVGVGSSVAVPVVDFMVTVLTVDDGWVVVGLDEDNLVCDVVVDPVVRDSGVALVDGVAIVVPEECCDVVSNVVYVVDCLPIELGWVVFGCVVVLPDTVVVCSVVEGGDVPDLVEEGIGVVVNGAVGSACVVISVTAVVNEVVADGVCVASLLDSNVVETVGVISLAVVEPVVDSTVKDGVDVVEVNLSDSVVLCDSVLDCETVINATA